MHSLASAGSQANIINDLEQPMLGKNERSARSSERIGETTSGYSGSATTRLFYAGTSSISTLGYESGDDELNIGGESITIADQE